MADDRQARLEDEIGDILFVIVNIARVSQDRFGVGAEARQPKVQVAISIHGDASSPSRARTLEEIESR